LFTIQIGQEFCAAAFLSQQQQKERANKNQKWPWFHQLPSPHQHQVLFQEVPNTTNKADHAVLPGETCISLWEFTRTKTGS
jgi:hypothetical protein